MTAKTNLPAGGNQGRDPSYRGALYRGTVDPALQASRDDQDRQAQTGEQVHGFDLVCSEYVPELKAELSLWYAPENGLHVAHVQRRDAEKAQVISVRTPPPDNSGVAHILEHLVFCGSRRYPLPDVMLELDKSSTATALNASTGQDFTEYHCASLNHKDFVQLASAYLDTVFFPRLTEEHFLQESCHYYFEDSENLRGPLGITGVVYNEMRGASLTGIACGFSGTHPTAEMPAVNRTRSRNFLTSRYAIFIGVTTIRRTA